MSDLDRTQRLISGLGFGLSMKRNAHTELLLIYEINIIEAIQVTKNCSHVVFDFFKGSLVKYFSLVFTRDFKKEILIIDKMFILV